jgi:lipopolysaccharide export LptBFGC system permease protein LptF
MKLTVLKPDRNETPQLWRRLAAGTSMPIVIFAVVVAAFLTMRSEERAMRATGLVLLVLMFGLALLHAAGK